jgi:hypothetical protein
MVYARMKVTTLGLKYTISHRSYLKLVTIRLLPEVCKKFNKIYFIFLKLV